MPPVTSRGYSFDQHNPSNPGLEASTTPATSSKASVTTRPTAQQARLALQTGECGSRSSVVLVGLGWVGSAGSCCQGVMMTYMLFWSRNGRLGPLNTGVDERIRSPPTTMGTSMCFGQMCYIVNIAL